MYGPIEKDNFANENATENAINDSFVRTARRYDFEKWSS